MEYHLTTPLSKDDIIQLQCGDVVYLSGTVLTARDEAHARILEMSVMEEELPFGLDGTAIYHCGPLMQKKDGDWVPIAAGPTTSGRMSKLTPPLLDKYQVRALIGKGGMTGVTGSLEDKCVYLAYTGGCAALAAGAITNVSDVHWLDLGMPEAVWLLEMKEFGPLVVGIDAHGNDLFSDIRKRGKQAFSMLDP